MNGALEHFRLQYNIRQGQMKLPGYKASLRSPVGSLTKPVYILYGCSYKNTSEMAYFRFDLTYVIRICTNRGPLGPARLIVQAFLKPFRHLCKPLLCPHYPYGDRRLRVRIFAIPWPKTCRKPIKRS